MEHFYIKFGDLAALLKDILLINRQRDRQTDKQTNAVKTLPLRLPSAWVNTVRYEKKLKAIRYIV